MKTISLLYSRLELSQILTGAINLGSESIVEYLLEHGADVNQSDSDFGIYPLQLACSGHNRQSMALFLLNSGADPTKHYPESDLSCLGALAFGSLGPLTSTLVEEMVKRGCSYALYPGYLRMLFIKALRSGNFHLAGNILSLPGVEKHKILKGTLGDFIGENTRDILPAVHFLLRIEPVDPVLFQSENGLSIFHRLAGIRETLRDDKLNHQLARKIISVHRNPDYLNCKDSKGRTALDLAVETGNHLLLKEIILAANSLAARASGQVAILLIDRISDLGDVPLLGIDFYTTMTRYKTYNLRLNNTIQLVLTWVNYLDTEHALPRDVANRADENDVKKLLKVWEQTDVFISKFEKSLRQTISQGVTLKITNRVLIDDGDVRGYRPLTFEEKKNSTLISSRTGYPILLRITLTALGALLLWQEFLSDLHQSI